MRLPESEDAQEVDSILPLINVVFLLLIFFMLLGALQGSDLFAVKPPVSRSVEQSANQQPLILVGAGGRLAFDGRELDELDLQLSVSDLLATEPDPLIRVKADLRAEARRVVEVMELLNAVGVERILLLSVEAKP